MQKTNNLILVTIDGYRWQEVFQGGDSAILFNKKYRVQDSAAVMHKYWAATPAERRAKLMPFFWDTIAAKGQLYGNRELGNEVNVKNKYWFSYPGRSETLCGYYDSLVNSNDYPNNPNENVLEWINKQPGYAGQVAAFASWDAVARILNRDRSGLMLNNTFEPVKGSPLTEAQQLANELQYYLPSYFGSIERFDVTTYAIARSYMTAHHPKVVYLDFGDPDELAHAGQYDLYLDAGHYLDAMIGSLWNLVQQDAFYKDNTTIMIFPDHGRGVHEKWTDHGSSVPGADQTWLAVLGPGKPLQRGEIKMGARLYQQQFAQTAAGLLGLVFTANHPVAAAVKTVLASAANR